jgi:membrane protease YdiL (CAAX protease family)
MMLAFRLSDLPPNAGRLLPPSLDIPLWTLLPGLVMLSVVAGVCEEVGIRGYLQKPLEDLGLPTPAILLSATVFVLLHGNKEWFIQQALPMFVAAVWYGYFTAKTNSIYPMILVHTLADVALLTYFEVFRAPLPVSIYQEAISLTFWFNLGLAVVSCVLAFAFTAQISLKQRSALADAYLRTH